MRFNNDNVDIDEKLIDHLEKDELVIFVGAGVSAKAYPHQGEKTYYPTFKELVYEIAKRIGKKLSDEEERLLKKGFSDRILGMWDRDEGNIHSIAMEILRENEDGQRTVLHQAIVRLFPEGAEPRIVTTNFDNLLIRARKAEGFESDPRWQIFEAPSLPPANKDRFKGICFLHGRVNHPKEMILTDKDIGRAYMDEGWALRFAHDLFRNFNVLFVGYSLEDPPLRYLSLALEGNNDKEHWALIPDEPNKSRRDDVERDWKRRGVKPIWVTAKRKDFRATERTINNWAEDNRRGYIDKKNLLSGWASTSPIQLPPYEVDRARLFLQTLELLRDFAENDLDENWFDKLVEWGHFDFILKSAGKPDHKDAILSDKLINWLNRNPEKWMVKLVPYRRSINVYLFEIFCRYFEKNNESDKIDVGHLRKLLEFFRPVIEKDPLKSFSLWIGKLLRKCIEEGLIDDAAWFFSVVTHTEPIVTITPNLYYEFVKQSGEDVPETPLQKIEFDVNSKDLRYYHLRDCIRDIFLPNIEKIGSPLIVSLTNQFLDLRRALKRSGLGQYTYMWRKAIEDHEQDKHRDDVVDFFINSLRDLWEALLAKEPDQALKIYEFWREIDDVLFKRLSLHAARRILESGNAQ
jgi:hypothetical protein